MAMKFRAHDTFYIRKGWLSKGLKHIQEEDKSDLFISKTENPMDVLGIGANQVKAMRYWMTSVGLTSEPTSGKRLQSLTNMGKYIRKNDMYLEELGTLYLLQYCLAKNKEEATSWYFFFNEFMLSEFTREDFVQALQNYIMMSDEDLTVAIRSLNDDFACIVNTYLPRYKSSPVKVTPENNIDCPFGELGLIDISNKRKKTYKKAIPSAESFDPWIVMAVIVDQAQGRDEIGLNELLTAPCNIGRVFNLDAITILDILHNVESAGIIKIIRTAGLDVIYINEKLSFEHCIEKYYETISEEM